MWYDWGCQPVNSTNVAEGTTNNPSSSALLAEIDSTQLGTVNLIGNQTKNFRVTWLLGCDTNATFLCEVVNSTVVPPTQGDQIVIRTPVNQSGQYMTNHAVPQNGRIRVRSANNISAGNAYVTIQAEPVT